jgi:hypothetical protein
MPSPALIDRFLHAKAAQLTGGLSPAALAGALMDWLVHLTYSPGKQIELAERVAANALDGEENATMTDALFCRAALGASLYLLAAPPTAAETAPPAADYVCVYGCRPTDANPRLEIEGNVARCWNEIGGLYVGEFHPPDIVACFRKTGRILDGGARIEWSDGVRWRRH